MMLCSGFFGWFSRFKFYILSLEKAIFMVYIIEQCYTQTLETWFHYVILIRSNQEGFNSGEDFLGN